MATAAKTQVMIGLLGQKLDRGRRPVRANDASRWSIWRPSVGVFQHEDFVIDRFEIISGPGQEKLLETVVADIRSVSPETEVRSHLLAIDDPWDFEEVYGTLHRWADSLQLDPEHEDYLVHITTGTHVEQICLYLLTESRHLPGRLLQTSPLPTRKSDARGMYRIIDLDLSRYDALATRFALQKADDLQFLKSGINTRSPNFNEVIAKLERVSLTTQAPILITGPTGAGKSQLARRVYQLKRQRQHLSGSFIEVNCATIRGDQSMSTLFGHTRGAFTGASAARNGLLRAADEGILFLDEIGELGLDEQAMTLRAIEEKQFLPVGSDQSVASNFQLLAGTNRDLHADVRSGRFREDLLARINVWSFELPGLAERREDIEPNLDYELRRFTSETGHSIRMNKEARERFLEFAQQDVATWCGNFRDLNAAVTRMATLSTSGRITVEEVADEIQRLRSAWQSLAPPPGGPATDVLSSVMPSTAVDQLDHFDRVQLAEVVRVCRECATLSEAGRRLFQISRQSKKQPNDADRLRKYLGKFDLAWRDL